MKPHFCTSRAALSIHMIQPQVPTSFLLRPKYAPYAGETLDFSKTKRLACIIRHPGQRPSHTTQKPFLDEAPSTTTTSPKNMHFLYVKQPSSCFGLSPHPNFGCFFPSTLLFRICSFHAALPYNHAFRLHYKPFWEVPRVEGTDAVAS